jgi:hypothetical protein
MTPTRRRAIKKRIEVLRLERAAIAEEMKKAIAELMDAIGEERDDGFVERVLSKLGEKPN